MNMVARWLSDEYQESIREFERKAFYEQVQDEQQEILSALRSSVSTWTENEIEAGNTPQLESFCEEYPEWDHQALIDIIAAEITRVARLCGI